MSPARIAALPHKAHAVVLFPIGAIEQHGPHLPVAVDALMGQIWTKLILEHLTGGTPCYVAPAITVGKSNEHTGFPGTLMIRKETLRELILCVGRQIAAWGFKHLGVINTHGGNVAVLVPTLRELAAETGLRAEVIRSKANLGLSMQEATYGIHANETETAWMLAAAGPLVDLSQAQCEYFARVNDPGNIRPVAAPVIRAWATRDLSKSGIMGDAPAATVEKGQRWLEQISRSMAEAVVAMSAGGNL
ncbi:MAG TPA: creatininase family protein [Opitutaceae bacterium]